MHDWRSRSFNICSCPSGCRCKLHARVCGTAQSTYQAPISPTGINTTLLCSYSACFKDLWSQLGSFSTQILPARAGSKLECTVMTVIYPAELECCVQRLTSLTKQKALLPKKLVPELLIEKIFRISVPDQIFDFSSIQYYRWSTAVVSLRLPILHLFRLDTRKIF